MYLENQDRKTQLQSAGKGHGNAIPVIGARAVTIDALYELCISDLEHSGKSKTETMIQRQARCHL